VRDPFHRQPWVRAALAAGLAYLVIGRVFAAPSSNVKVWRFAAWLSGLVIFAAHIWYEHLKLRNGGRRAASHISAAVAFGASGLALAAMIHSLAIAPGARHRWYLALVLWPAITAIPAFVAALIGGAILDRVLERGAAERR
jgi:hypothetical protein